MSDGATLIDPSGIPHFIGDLSTLDTDVMLLTANAAQFRASGADVHTTFQNLSAVYRTPDAADLLSSTQPVKAKADGFADDLEKVASALSDYSAEVQPLIDRLATLKTDATVFVDSLSGDDDWRKDQDKVDRNNELWRDVNHTVAAFQAAERTCHNKITALVGGSKITVDDGSHGDHMYGYRAEDLDHAPETPWGAPAEREYEGWDWLTHQAGQVWDGIWTDGVMATIHGVGTLFGADGSDAAGQAWKGLAQLATASALTSATLGTWWLLPEDKLPSWLRESRTAYKQTVKGFVAWDTWKTNPSRAAGAVGFNVLTLLGTEGTGAAAKTGATARALSTASRIGRAIDPMTYAGKAGTFAFTKVGDTFRTLKNLHSGTTLDLLERADALRSPKIPDNAIPYLDDATGKLVYLTDEGHLLNADGTLHQHVSKAQVEPSAAERSASPVAGVRESELVGAHAGRNSVTDTGRAAEHVAENGARDFGQHPGVGENPPAAGSGTAHGSGGGSGTDRSTGSGSGPDRPDGDGTQGERQEREPSTEERKAIQDEHVRKANEDPEWFKEHYDTLGRRRPNIGLVDGVELPQLAKDPQGRWVAKHNLPSGPSEVRFGSKPLPRGTAPDEVLPSLDRRVADRQAYRELMNAQRAFDKTPSAANQQVLAAAQEAYARQLGDVPPNSKIPERLGEDASRLHAIRHEFPDAEPVELPKTANGADMFDGAYRLGDDRILIVEDKAPGNDLDWRQGRADPEDPVQPHLGDDGGAAGMRVKQGTYMYLRTILAEMTKRGDVDAELASEFRAALKAGKLQYVLVKVRDPDGSLYAGVIVEHLRV
ncbi:hypothetical protein ABZ464_17180 [Streptomyces sp. NPDC005820]|uniref:hypothetical protein n=1 Tax=Streptomyces sp. NPDC005820 TaxID=3157069 RepID=UPI0033E9E154